LSVCRRVSVLTRYRIVRSPDCWRRGPHLVECKETLFSSPLLRLLLEPSRVLPFFLERVLDACETQRFFPRPNAFMLLRPLEPPLQTLIPHPTPWSSSSSAFSARAYSSLFLPLFPPDVALTPTPLPASFFQHRPFDFMPRSPQFSSDLVRPTLAFPPHRLQIFCQCGFFPPNPAPDRGRRRVQFTNTSPFLFFSRDKFPPASLLFEGFKLFSKEHLVMLILF